MSEVLAIAVDFATTFSSIAYVPINDLTAPTQLGNWPGQPHGKQNYKVPTIVSYPSDPTLPYLWGYSAERPPISTPYLSYSRVRAFKPCLRPELANEFAASAPAGKTVDNVVHDFLQGMYEHLIQTLTTQGLSTAQGYKYHVLFTVPAPFELITVERFRRLVMGTGWGQHTVEIELTEPEAAALHTIKTQRAVMKTSAGFQRDQCFVVCDAGGGTVDLASYTITELEPDIKIAQTGIVHGGFCGSTIIDKGFTTYVKSVMGDTIYRSINPSTRYALMDEFVANKEWFSDSPQMNQIGIRVPPDFPQCPGLVGGFLMISREQMRAFFEPAVEETCRLVIEHIQECRTKGYQPTYVFLVGGFGTSPYLRARLEAYVRQVEPYMMIITPREADQSVVLGCLSSVQRQLEKKPDPVTVRLCRLNIGLIVQEPFDPTRHWPYEKVIDPQTGVAMAQNQILWLIKKGDPITFTEGVYCDRTLLRTSKGKVTTQWTETLVISDAAVPPQRIGQDVTTLCIIGTDMRSCNVTDFEKVKKPSSFICGKSTKHYNIYYTVRIIVGITNLKFQMWFGGTLRHELMNIKYVDLER